MISNRTKSTREGLYLIHLRMFLFSLANKEDPVTQSLRLGVFTVIAVLSTLTKFIQLCFLFISSLSLSLSLCQYCLNQIINLNKCGIFFFLINWTWSNLLTLKTSFWSLHWIEKSCLTKQFVPISTTSAGPLWDPTLKKLRLPCPWTTAFRWYITVSQFFFSLAR